MYQEAIVNESRSVIWSKLNLLAAANAAGGSMTGRGTLARLIP